MKFYLQYSSLGLTLFVVIFVVFIICVVIMLWCKVRMYVRQ